MSNVILLRLTRNRNDKDYLFFRNLANNISKKLLNYKIYLIVYSTVELYFDIQLERCVKIFAKDITFSGIHI